MSLTEHSAPRLTVIGASAGSGKTHRLTEIVEEAVVGQGRPAVLPEGLVAVTYTRRAHVELESRIRRKLLQSPTPERAMKLPLAYLGTVHAVCLRWIRELAIDAGVSPEVEVLVEDNALSHVLEDAVPVELRERLDALSRTLEIHKDQRKDLVDWAMPVNEIVTLARHGRIKPAALEAMAERSIETFLRLFTAPAAPDGDALDAALQLELDAAIRALETNGDTTKGAAAALARLRHDRADLRFGPLPWSEWVHLSGLDITKKSRSAVSRLEVAASRYREHPRLRAECAELIRAVFRASAIALERYDAWKKERGLVDYVDMIDSALAVLEDPEVARDMRQRLELVVVDEMQDSSPIQLALFLRLHRLAQRSAWVGDPKQCIFEYAGADPRLMDAVLQWSRRGGGTPERLSTNHRSRPELVALCGELFATAFAAHGLSREAVACAAERPSEPRLASLPALGLFYLESPNKGQDAAAIAAGVARMLAAPEETPVLDPATKLVRPVAPGDISILVHTNAEASALATALASHGVRAALARDGLMVTPEGWLLTAALRYLLDERDAGALAEVEALTGFDGEDPDAWLSRKLRRHLEGTGEAEAKPAWQVSLDALRVPALLLSPTELVEAVLLALDFTTLAARWPNAPQRLANLDALRKFAEVYEQRCLDDGEGASPAGLLRFLNDIAEKRYRQAEERGADEQHAGADAGAVTVMTYHKSKGLEWPVVVMASLDRQSRPRQAFKVTPETDVAEIDPDQPLAGRWIRYWPWPFSPIRNAPLEDDAARSPEGISAAERERRERARLLYVGFTRARDHLILAARLKNGVPETAWVDELQAPDGTRALSFPAPDASEPHVVIRRSEGPPPLAVPARLRCLQPLEPELEPEDESRVWFARAVADTPRSPYAIRPSDGEASGLNADRLAIAAVHVIHPPFALETKGQVEWNKIGDAIHAFLAADVEGLTPAERLERATRLLQVEGALGSYSPERVIEAADAFRAFVERDVPGAIWRREVPVQVRVETPEGERFIDGRIDLLLESEKGVVIVDHKSFAGTGEAAWRKKTEEFVGQLAVYAHAVGRVGGKKEVGCWVHFTVGGGVVVLEGR